MKTIYILGNPLFEQDSSAINLLPKLQEALPNFNFQHLDPTENLPEEPHLILIDTILGLKEVRTLNESELDKIRSSPQVSLHDFDLGFQLKLAKKLGQIEKVTIIGIPEKFSPQILQQIISLIERIDKSS